MKLYYLFLLVMFLLMGCTNISGSNTIGGHEYIKLVKEERSQW